LGAAVGGASGSGAAGASAAACLADPETGGAAAKRVGALGAAAERVGALGVAAEEAGAVGAVLNGIAVGSTARRAARAEVATTAVGC
jgi:hypothetical protein